MGLRETLKKMKEESAAKIPPDALQVMMQATKGLEESGQAENSLAVGAKIPAFSLRGHDDAVTTSEDLASRAPLVLMFYRGVW